MNIEDVALDKDLTLLWRQLQMLRSQLQEHTWSRYRRVNPFNEDLFDWKDKGRFVCGKDVTVYDSTTVVGNVSIGDHSWVGPFCSLDGTGGLSIGKYCSISAGTHIQTHDTVKWALSGGRIPYEYSSVTIGDCCFIAVNAVITSGVTVGNHCVVAAGAVVTNDVADYSMVAGVPARLIGRVELKDASVELIFGKGKT